MYLLNTLFFLIKSCQVVRKGASIECVCHGISRSCGLKTCWRKLIVFNTIGAILLGKYDAAIHVELKSQQGRVILSPKRTKESTTQLPPTKSELVFLEASPNYCYENLLQDIPGTRGRRCFVDNSPSNCQTVCCDKGYNTRSETVNVPCSCIYHWCCEVRCETCITKVTNHTCK